MSDSRFKSVVWRHYDQHKRSFPWRRTENPYKILLSELMLQQTQAERVVPKYNAFLKQYPTLASLGEATYRDVLLLWSGLGYNRRAKYLLDIAESTSGRLPKTYMELILLPGIGPYTAAAIMNFAHEKATPMIETNIRTAYLHHYFKDQCNVSDKELLKYVERTMDTDNPKEWFNALMDHGAYLKGRYGNSNIRSAHYKKQSAFKGSNREVRGAILRTLLSEKKVTALSLNKELQRNIALIEKILKTLEKEQLILRKNKSYILK